MYKDDPFMQAERVSRHYGISMECNFSTQMFRWVNDIIKFVDLNKKLEKIGIYEIENQMLAYKQTRLNIQKVFLSPEVFKRLK